MKAQAVRLGDVCDFIRGVTFSSGEARAETLEDSIACLTTSGVQQEVAWESRRFIPRERVGNDRQILRAGDILISTANSKELVGKSCIVRRSPFACTFGVFVTVARPKEPVLPDYLAYWMGTSSFLRWCLQNSSNTTNISNLRVSDLEDLKFPLPSLSKQQRITRLLEQADRLRRTRRYTLELSDTFLPAAFLELFGDPVRNPRGFPRERLEDLIQSDRSITYGILKPGPDIPDGVPYVRVTDIQEGLILLDAVRRTSAEIDRAYKRSRLRAGDLLMSIRGHVGRLAIVPTRLDGANITQDTARLAPVKALDAHFLMGCLAAESIQHLMGQLTKGVAVTGINLGDVKELSIPVPPLPMQQRFASLVQRQERLQAAQREALRQAEHLFQSLLHRAFSGDHDHEGAEALTEPRPAPSQS